MTRENLIGAIYDNEEEWSCAYTCPHTMEEENPKEVCWRCAEKQLSEYEQQIRADAIDEILKNIEIGIDATGHSDQYTTGFCNALIWLKSCITHEEPQFLVQLKEQNK